MPPSLARSLLAPAYGRVLRLYVNSLVAAVDTRPLVAGEALFSRDTHAVLSLCSSGGSSA